MSNDLLASPPPCSIRVFAAAEADLVEPEEGPVPLVRASAPSPGLRPIAPLERRSPRPLGPGRCYPLLDVSDEIVNPVRADAAGKGTCRLALPETLRLRLADGGVVRADVR